MYTLNGLEKHLAYQVRISAFNVNGTGPWSEWMTIETYENDLDETKVPNPPSSLRSMFYSRRIISFLEIR